MIYTVGWMLLAQAHLIRGTPPNYPPPPLPQIQGRILPILLAIREHLPQVLLSRAEQVMDIPLHYPNNLLPHRPLVWRLHHPGAGGSCGCLMSRATVENGQCPRPRPRQHRPQLQRLSQVQIRSQIQTHPLLAFPLCPSIDVVRMKLQYVLWIKDSIPGCLSVGVFPIGCNIPL